MPNTARKGYSERTVTWSISRHGSVEAFAALNVLIDVPAVVGVLRDSCASSQLVSFKIWVTSSAEFIFEESFHLNAVRVTTAHDAATVSTFSHHARQVHV
jgi:hypothetical protein